MSEAIEQKTVELMDRTANAVEAFAGKLDALSKEFGPEVADAALTVARVDAANALMVQVFGLAAVIALLVAAWKMLPRFWKFAFEDTKDSRLATILTGLVSLPLLLPAGIIFLTVVATIWPLAGVIEPKLWIAKQVLGL